MPGTAHTRVSRTLALAVGTTVAVICERWSSLVKTTTRVSGSVCCVPVRNPGAGTAETKHTRVRPYWTVTFPPCDGTVCSPGPPLHCGDGRGAGVVAAGSRLGVGEGVRGAGDACTEGRAGDAVGVRGGSATAEAGAPTSADGEGYTAWTDRAEGGVGRVRPITKYTVSMTAVTLAVVHDSHMRR